MAIGDRSRLKIKDSNSIYTGIAFRLYSKGGLLCVVGEVRDLHEQAASTSQHQHISPVSALWKTCMDPIMDSLTGNLGKGVGPSEASLVRFCYLRGLVAKRMVETLFRSLS